MPQQVVFSCQSCGASVSAEAGASTAQCQFCGSTVSLPKEMRGQATPYYVSVMGPLMADRNKIFRGVMGFNIALTLAIFGFTACIFIFVFVAVGLAFMPAMFGGLGPFFGR